MMSPSDAVGRASAIGRGHGQSASTTTAMPWPPPMQAEPMP